VLLVVGIFLIVVGISDFAVAALLARQQASATGGLGAPEPPPAARILRGTGAVTVVIGVVLTVVALLS
jgi:hypothetical protein